MKTLFKLFLFAVLLALLVLALVVTLRVGPTPTLEVSPSAKAIGPRTSVRLAASAPGRGIAGVRVELAQGGTTTVVERRQARPLPPWSLGGRQPALELSAEVGSQAVPTLEQGEATLRVVVERAPTWLRRPAPLVRGLTLPVLLRPPALSLVSAQHNVAQGGAGVVVYRVSETATRDGVRAGEWFFPGAALPGAAGGERFAFFGVPWDLAEAAGVRLQAEDAAGNVAELGFVDHFAARPPARDRIELQDEFIARVVQEIGSQTPGLADQGSPIANYLQLNRELRRRNATELARLAEGSAARFLWKRAFLPPRGAKVMSAFADHRTYLYGGREVDQQTHLGFDLASTARTPVPAANDGVVLLTRYFGIYGNTVVLDHGFGLLTLYSHLSAIQVEQGQSVERGATLGLSGRSGLAGGDHLHFTTLVRGLPVTPVEWWDAHWIRDNVTAKLAPALVLEAEAAGAR